MNTPVSAAPSFVVSDPLGREYLLSIGDDGPEGKYQFQVFRQVDQRWVAVGPELLSEAARREIVLSAVQQYCAAIWDVLCAHQLGV